MGGDIVVLSKSANVNIQMESDLVYLMNDAWKNEKGLDYITSKCKESFGGSWILIYSSTGSDCSFKMSFAFFFFKMDKIKKRKGWFLLFISNF